MKRCALLVAMIMSCVSYGVVTYKCDKDYVVYQMEPDEAFLIQNILQDRYFALQFMFSDDAYGNYSNDKTDLPSMLMVFENDEKFIDLIRYPSVFREMFPALCNEDILAVREKFEIRKRDICIEGQNQKLFTYLKESFALWRMRSQLLKKTQEEYQFMQPSYCVNTISTADIPEVNISEESLHNMNVSDLVFEVKVKR